MNTKTIDQANTADLRGSWAVLQRVPEPPARQTDTQLVMGRNGVTQRIKPQFGSADHRVQEIAVRYKDRP